MHERRKRRGKPVVWSTCGLQFMILLFALVMMVGLPTALVLNNRTTASPFEEMTLVENTTLMLGADDMLNAGDVIKINITVSNTGTLPLFDVVLEQEAPEIMVVCMPYGMNATIGTLLPGVSEYCIGMYMISQDDIDAGGWMWSTTFLNGTYGITVDVNLTQSTFGMLTVTQMGTLDLGMDGTVTVGDIVTVDVKVMNTGTETALNVSATNEVVPLGDMLPMNMFTYTYMYALTEEDTLRGNLTLFNEAVGTGTTSAQPIVGNTTTVLDFSAEDSRLLSASKEWMYTGPTCVQPGEIVLFTITVENTGTLSIDSVTATDSLVGTSLICSPMGTNNVIGTMFPGDVQTCTGSYMFVMSEVAYGENTVLDTTFSVTGTGGANIDGASVYSNRGPYIYYMDFQASPRPSGPFSSLDWSFTGAGSLGFGTNVALNSFCTPDGFTRTLRLNGLNGLAAVRFENFATTSDVDRLVFFIEGIALASSPVQVVTDPPTAVDNFYVGNVGVHTYDAMTHEITSTLPTSSMTPRSYTGATWFVQAYPGLNWIEFRFTNTWVSGDQIGFYVQEINLPP